VKIIIIAALTSKRVIGNNGKLPWHLPEELNHFKETTSGFPIIMGRKTWNSINYPLADRINIVISAGQLPFENTENLLKFDSIVKTIEYCRLKGYEKVYIIGGESVFQQTMPMADELILSEIKIEFSGDCYFPEINNSEWDQRVLKEFTDFTVHHYIRRVN
jgi:dihydrofolate reductase